MKLYRPVGIKELLLISDLGFRKFPPRLDWQPIFYPVLKFEYAKRIAFDWNTKDKASGFCGFVTTFEVNDSYVSKFEEQTVGGRDDTELWVPSEQLSEFNKNIEGTISVIYSTYGSSFSGTIDPNTNLPENIAATLKPYEAPSQQ